MPDIESIFQAIYQHHFMRYCGVTLDRFAYDWMLNAQAAGIDIAPCFKTFCEWVNNHA